MNDKPNINIEKANKCSGLFTNYIYKAIPLAFDESLSYLEQVCGVLNYLKNTIIPVVNNNADATEEIQELFIKLEDYVNNYFDNLDVQEEINNKLDGLVEDGTLPNIVQSFLQSTAIFSFDNVSQMKQATNLTDGSYAKTYGFYNKNDNGGSFYKIRNKTDDDIIDEITKIEINDTLLAELHITTKMDVQQFGCKADGITDDSNNIQLAINNCKYITFSGSQYLCKEININSNKTIDGLNTNIIMNSETKLFHNNFNSENIDNNIIIKNFNIDCTNVIGSNQQNNVIYLCGLNNSKIENINIKNSKSDGIYIGSYNLNKTNKNIKIENCNISNSTRNNITLICGDVIVDNCNLVGGTLNSIDIEPNLNNENSNLIVINSLIENGQINVYAKEEIRDNVDMNITIQNCNIKNNNRMLFIEYANNCKIINNKIIDNNSSNPLLILYKINNLIFNDNTVNSNQNVTSLRISENNNVVVNNNIISNSNIAIELINISNSVINNNRLINNKQIGLYNRGTSINNQYISNYILNGVNGIYLDTGTYQIVNENIIDCNNSLTTRSIILSSNTNNVLCCQNIAKNYSEYGVRNSGTSNITDNNIESQA